MTFLSFLSLNVMRYGHILSQDLRPLGKTKALDILAHALERLCKHMLRA